MYVKAIHDEGRNEPTIQHISKDEKISLERFHHPIKDLTGAQLHHDFRQDDNQGNDGKTNVSAPSAECLVRFKPEELHISDAPWVIFKKKSSRVLCE